MELETIVMLGIAWALGIVTGWGIACAAVVRNARPHVYPAPPKTKKPDVHAECDTCGQIDSNLKGGLCAWCQNVYPDRKVSR